MDRGRITWKIRGALQVYDSFSARPANLSKLRIWTEEGICVMKKEGGLLVFAESEGGLPARGGAEEKENVFTRIRLESPLFLSEELTLSSSPEHLPMCLRLRPSKAYPVSSGTAVLYGHCTPEAEVFFSFDGQTNPGGDGNEKKLLSDVSPDAQAVEIYHPGRNSLEGEWIELEYKNFRERLFLGQKKASDTKRPDTGKYSLQGERKNTYPRLETALRLLYFTRASQEGEYIFYFRQVPGGQEKGRICLQSEKNGKKGKQKEEWEITIAQGESIRLDLQ